MCESSRNIKMKAPSGLIALNFCRPRPQEIADLLHCVAPQLPVFPQIHFNSPLMRIHFFQWFAKFLKICITFFVLQYYFTSSDLDILLKVELLFGGKCFGVR